MKKIDIAIQENENISQTFADSILGEWKCIIAQQGDEVVPIMEDSYIFFNENKDFTLHLDNNTEYTGKWEFENYNKEISIWKLIFDSEENIWCFAGSKDSVLNIQLGDINLGFYKTEKKDTKDLESYGMGNWEFYDEYSSMPTPDSSVKGIFFKEKRDDSYIYDLSDNAHDADMNFKAYGAVLLGCGFTIESDDGLYKVLDELGATVAFMGTGNEDDSYFLLIYIW